MTDPDTHITEPLTPAELAALQQWAADREAALQSAISAYIEAAVAPLRSQIEALTAQVATMQESLTVLDGAALKVGSSVALRIASGKLLCTTDGGPTSDGQPIELEARSSVGHWESFHLEQGV
jgi:hypothetical protein